MTYNEDFTRCEAMEKLNEKESFSIGVYIAGLYESCDSITKEALIMAFLDDMKETDVKRWLSIMHKNMLEQEQLND